MSKITLKAKIISLNKYTNANRNNRFGGSKIKKKLTNYYLNQINDFKVKEKQPLKIKITWHLTDRRKDPDNVAFNKKFVLDAFVKKGIIENDGPKQIESFQDIFVYDNQKEFLEVEFKWF